MSTDTPETDTAKKFEIQVYPHVNGTIETVHVDFARSLETRLRTALRAIEEAPHEASCAIFQPFAGLGQFDCDCWKSRLNTQPAE